ncbi:methyltransferase domain-containing protein [Halobacterium salinarum]|uniref:methyltransferase domain-containing protein n=2 Tax=Halobacterium salinarum TaxID=2242 RepID=UPI001F2C60C5|nr:methyltransferase domain-containing protein [Halobacterium salinarum]MCF2165547.1 SAM-dependent methyltransferase [Halobacterium salinarum]MCF2168716.1 SAM-dependent methyltransferase [Halobacterium salinarum]MCF2207496.1 SAM-dependent methyltransferase [Halobacterium salinarum]MCF2238128.1 SAM-dependent methyltransferase [Halobacterium salinarum]WJK62912.1 SAM-dependent methyltransferase [Halobacterium salinarum]
MTQTHAQTRYLTAKQSVDERARDRRVRDRLRAALPSHPRVVEAGCGTGPTVPMLYADWEVTPAAYLGVDAAERVVAFANAVVPRVLRRRMPAETRITATPDGCRVGDAPIRFDTGDALARLTDATADLLVAQSFLDLVPPADALDAFADALAPGGLAYAPLTFDGVTVLQPSHPADDRVRAAYHDAIDAADGRTSRAGRRLLDVLRERPAETLLAVGASDWIVRPVDGEYRADEQYFLACILSFIADAVPDATDWLATRRQQLAAGDLTYVAHGYDLLWRA